VPKDVKDSVTKEEEKRQNAIYDIIKTEKNYVEELKMIQSVGIELEGGRLIMPFLTYSILNSYMRFLSKRQIS
jgi:hypothetical protein